MTTITKREAFRLQACKLVIDHNPKKKGTMSWDRFENYFTLDRDSDWTVKDFLDAGVRMDDIRHDSEHGFILVGDEAIEAYEERMEIEREKKIEEARALLASIGE